MKSILPFVTIAGITAILAAVLAPPRDVGAQDAASIFDQWDEEREASSENVDPYRTISPSETPPAVDFTALPQGDALIAAVIDGLQRHMSLSARMQHQVSFAGQEFYGSGIYCQQGQGDELQVYLELQMNGQEASFLQVNNGRILWVDRRLPTGRSIASYNLRLLREEVRTGRGSEFELGDEGSPIAGGWAPSAYDGGLPGLFASLSDKFQFLRAQAMQLSLAPPLVETAKDVPVYAVIGHWKPEKLPILVSAETQHSAQAAANETAGVTKSMIPDRFPEEVLLLIGQQDLFPYWIEYRRLEPRAGQASAQPNAFYHLSANPMVVVKFADVKFDVPIATGLFDYTPPPKVEWSDQTGALIQRLRKQRAVNVASGSLPDSPPR
jgi:hypothetical protein